MFTKTIGMIVLNEAEMIAANLAQHYGWADRIVIVEGADVHYPDANVTAGGLSTDGTAEIVRAFPDPERKIELVQHGWAGSDGQPEAGKVELRNEYAKRAGDGFLFVVDADEFYTAADQIRIFDAILKQPEAWAWTFPILHLWKSTERIVIGSYADVPHTRFFRWRTGFRYSDNHNFPRDFDGKPLEGPRVERSLQETSLGWRSGTPAAVHWGFAKKPENVRDKTDYYVARGEAETRPETTSFRGAWFQDDLPVGCQLLDFAGPFPEHKAS